MTSVIVYINGNRTNYGTYHQFCGTFIVSSSSPFLPRGKQILAKTLLWDGECVIFLWLGSDEKNLGEFCLGDTSKNVYFRFSGLQNKFLSNLDTINVKVFANHGGMYRSDTKFKIFGEIKHRGSIEIWNFVSLILRDLVGNWHNARSAFCLSWPGFLSWFYLKNKGQQNRVGFILK